MRNPPILVSVIGFFALLAGFGYLFFGLRVLGFDWFEAPLAFLLDPANPWLPLTEATIRADGAEWTAKVVLANLDQAAELVRST